ncbi:MCE family protein [Allorhizocola rhizosphaerae]|uniref:MCE family protein n=1 Tax=Allorhizocola rhizosphaerae TaxID=1872709 RepID=UPI000E3C791D|nr:MCE family protein [Allorhizocola rhizosphaerae]
MQRLRQNPVWVGVAGLVVLAAVLLTSFNLESILNGGDRYAAAFRDASGLTPGNEVRIAGVKVGKVTAVRLDGARVRVEFRTTETLGDQTSATIRIKTVLGQKYLSLEPAGTGELRDMIPLERTASPFDVLQAVQGLADTAQRIDTDQLAKAFEVLSEAFADTPASVQASLNGLSRLSQTISSRDEQLRELLARANQVTGVLAARDEEFRRLITDGNLLLAEVTRRRDAIHRLLVATAELSDQLVGLVQDNRAQIQPALAQLREVVALLQRNKDQIAQTVSNLAGFLKAFANVVGNGRWFDSYVDGMIQAYTPSGGRR